jgi:hypothetical protein
MSDPRRVLSTVFCFVGAAVVAAGSIVPYASDCPTCRIIAPPGSSLAVWLPSATESLIAIGVALGAGIRLATVRKSSRYVAGFLTAVGILTIASFLPVAVHVGFPLGGVLGVGGVIGMTGGALLLTSGILEGTGRRPSGTRELEGLDAAEVETPRVTGPP